VQIPTQPQKPVLKEELIFSFYCGLSDSKITAAQKLLETPETYNNSADSV
jgi:hypothetical protein